MKMGNSMWIFKWAPHMKGGIMKMSEKDHWGLYRNHNLLDKQNMHFKPNIFDVAESNSIQPKS